MPRNASATNAILQAFRQSLGHSTAQRELKWIKEAAAKETSHDALTNMVKARAAGQPLAYVLGNQPFGDLTIKCRPPTLIPRPETEDWTFRLVNLLNETWSAHSEAIKVLDICTGTGCIPLLLASKYRRGPMHAIGVDISADAIKLALENVQHNPPPAGSTAQITQADFMDDSSFGEVAQKGPFDVVTCNPPYIPKPEYERLPPSVKAYEDVKALSGPDDDGLGFYRRLVEVITRTDLIKTGGIVAVEHGDGQSKGVCKVFERIGRGTAIKHWRDQWDKERSVVIRF